MSVYVVTGGVNGIGKATVDVLKSQGHTVYVIDNEGGDIVADLKTSAGRAFAVSEVFRLCPDGIDGLACIAGISSPKPDNSSILSVNYFGAVAVADGLFPLLEKKKGSCVMTASASMTWAKPENTPNVADLLVNCGDEERIARLVNSFAPNSPYNMYLTSKLAIVLWVRRHSVEWGIRGVNLTAIAPGCVETRLGVMPPELVAKLKTPLNESFHMTIPTHNDGLSIMPPEELGEAYAFMLSNKSRGINGSVVFVDAGQETFYNTEKIYF